MSSTPAATTPSTLIAPDSIARPYVRRRTMVAVEKKSAAETVIDGEVNGVIDANGKDVSHTMKGEAVVERSKDDARNLKKGGDDYESPRRRKHAQKSGKPIWVTVLSVLAKNCMLLAVLLWTGQVIWRWSDWTGGGSRSTFVGLKSLDYEERVSEVEASLKKTARLLQLQLEVVDKKIGNEVGTVVEELRLVEERHVRLEEELMELGGRADKLEKSLGQLKDMGLISREDLEMFWKELKASGSLVGSDKSATLDHIRAIAKDTVEKEIDKHAADGLGRVDYALASGGAKVVRHSEPYGFGKSNSWLAAAKGGNRVHANAHKMLEPSFGQPGQCFPLQGSSGFIDIRLRTGIIPEAVTLEHVSKSVAYDRSSAPRDCRLSAWFEAPDDGLSKRGEKMFLLTEFSYDLEKSNAQTFNVELVDSQVINMVRFEFTSNHGSTALTCIYRLRVHGYEPSLAAVAALQA